jgi:hypothetical protein
LESRKKNYWQERHAPLAPNKSAAATSSGACNMNRFKRNDAAKLAVELEISAVAGRSHCPGERVFQSAGQRTACR